MYFINNKVVRPITKKNNSMILLPNKMSLKETTHEKKKYFYKNLFDRNANKLAK